MTASCVNMPCWVWLQPVSTVSAVQAMVTASYVSVLAMVSASCVNIDLGGLVVTHSAAGAKGPWFNFTVARAYLRFNSWASTLAGKQCWLYAVRLQQTVIV